MKKYKISYTGFAYVEGCTAKEAEERFENDDCVYGELHVDSIEEANEFAVDI